MSMALGEGKMKQTNSLFSVNTFINHPIWPFYYGLILYLIGTSSFIFHASLTEFGYFMDYGNISLMANYVSLFVAMDSYYTGEMDETIGTLVFLLSIIIAYTNQYYRYLH